MNRLLRVIACVLLASVARAAETGFSQSLRPDDFTAAGLSKLSAAELARLDALVREYKSAAPSTAAPAAAPSTVPAAPATSVASSSAPAAAPRAQPSSAAPRPSAAPAKVTVAPGTEIEYSQIESRIVGEFSGWERRTIFTLENGQRWQADASSTYVGDRVQNPAVKIAPGLFGSYWMTVEGVNQRVKVKPLGER